MLNADFIGALDGGDGFMDLSSLGPLIEVLAFVPRVFCAIGAAEKPRRDKTRRMAYQHVQGAIVSK